ncbi:NADP-dependent oxidoreductase [Mycolicibacterium fluoranthenivorans]|jgi:NADPH-dependent curcumin reductase CurA|uniref:NADP-dependent oxidoreductase n=1 Tax=Mycolicibacterium fluoranthenivorans TaxID=258505 RepID=A0A7G8PHY6_9MYCO|nr:NADP-dependent oxidoreductase [Mycolicibacterium fluoranthenivorans]QNJ93952.1 NADP-dependent oxidoreductase [Mycolicibacterium fluoranthenivorans]
MTRVNTQCRLAARPVGLPTADSWNILQQEVPAAGDGEFVVEVDYLSIDPGSRTAMNAGDTYMPAIKIDEVMRAMAIGTVVESRHGEFSVGDQVSGMFGVQSYAVSDGEGVTKVDTTLAPAPVHLGALGISGLTAYFGLLDIGRPQPGQTVLVSGAAGSVGSIVGQIARIHGCRTIGVAGGEQKCQWLVDELGFDAAIDYKTANLRAELKTHAPDGIDVFFDNVGGKVLSAALNRLARGARIVLSGSVSQYNEPGAGPANYMQLLVARASMTGFVIFDYAERYPEAAEQLAKWLQTGELKSHESVEHGDISDFPETLLKLFRGENIGKLILALNGR